MTDASTRMVNLVWQQVLFMTPLIANGALGVFAFWQRQPIWVRRYWFSMPLATVLSIAFSQVLINLHCECTSFLQCGALRDFCKDTLYANPFPAPPDVKKIRTRDQMEWKTPPGVATNAAALVTLKAEGHVLHSRARASSASPSDEHYQASKVSKGFNGVSRLHGIRRARRKLQECREHHGASSLAASVNDTSSISIVQCYGSLIDKSAKMRRANAMLPQHDNPETIGSLPTREEQLRDEVRSIQEKTLSESSDAPDEPIFKLRDVGSILETSQTKKDNGDNKVISVEEANTSDKSLEGLADGLISKQESQAPELSKTMLPPKPKLLVGEGLSKSTLPHKPQSLLGEVTQDQGITDNLERSPSLNESLPDLEEEDLNMTGIMTGTSTRLTSTTKGWVKDLEKLWKTTCACDPEEGSCKVYTDPGTKKLKFWCPIRREDEEACRSFRDVYNETITLNQMNDGTGRLWTNDLCTRKSDGLGKCKCHRDLGYHITKENSEKRLSASAMKAKAATAADVEGISDIEVGHACRKWFEDDDMPWCVVGFDSACPDRKKVQATPGVVMWSSKLACQKRRLRQHLESPKRTCRNTRILLLVLDLLRYFMVPPILFLTWQFLMNRCNDPMGTDNEFEIEDFDDDDELSVSDDLDFPIEDSEEFSVDDKREKKRDSEKGKRGKGKPNRKDKGKKKKQSTLDEDSD
eukprot:gnl/MRDRNA2_/MRDRNA2_56523_c0_seq1.p1 gnl/MRDRNA2_/MRDRNA2_56523_c0~~gnl/MRDRNA2_/MRDRNA2_56523_c0_seq1.p1  ORF type:complete len:754 (-),score=104.57 gnl/MRDRNA2_/MRDRNA2_56523_c0_seq1:11-2095(-)